MSRVRKDRMLSSLEPRVGIVYLVKDKLWVESTPVSLAGSYGDFTNYERDHQEFWEELVHGRFVPDDPYEEHPRGRVVYSGGLDHFNVYLDRCILKRAELVRQISMDMHLPKQNVTTNTDPHYRCFKCLARGF